MNAEEQRRYLTKNPIVYAKFKELALFAHRCGKSRFSGTAIIGRMRWDSAISADSTGRFKINDHLTPTLCRDFMQDFNGIVPRDFLSLRQASYVPRADLPLFQFLIEDFPEVRP